MKSLRLIIALLLVGIAISGYAQDPRKRGSGNADKKTESVDKKGSNSSSSSSSSSGGNLQLTSPSGSKDLTKPSEPTGSRDVSGSRDASGSRDVSGSRDPEKSKEAEMSRESSSREPSKESSMESSRGSREASSSSAGRPQVSRSGSASASGNVSSGVSRRGQSAGSKRGKKEGAEGITDRQQSFYEVKEPSDADLQWMKVIYREVDLRKGKNAALLYPEMPNQDGENLYFIIMRLLAKNKISAYDYQDEIFDEKHKVNVGEMFDNYGIYYTEAKGSTQKAPLYDFEDADIRANQVLSYYIIEKWEFDTRSNQMKARVEYLCPVLHQEDDWSGETGRYPMFWVKLNDIRPYMARQYVFTDDDNNLARYSIDDFFKLNMYTGSIIKTKNLRNLSLKQMFPEEEAYKHAQDSIEQRLRSFNQDLWVPALDVLQARAEAEEKARAEAEGELTEDEEGAEKVETDGGNDEEKEKVTRTTKRGSKSKDTKSTSKSKSKTKKTKVKERKPKTSTQTVNTGVRSVRSRRN